MVSFGMAFYGVYIIPRLVSRLLILVVQHYGSDSALRAQHIIHGQISCCSSYLS